MNLMKQCGNPHEAILMLKRKQTTTLFECTEDYQEI